MNMSSEPGKSESAEGTENVCVLKGKENDEEEWISGEDLSTEGSSDEGSNKKHRKEKSKRTRRIYRPAMVGYTQQQQASAPSDADVQSTSDLPECIQWKPKRGSIKLPELPEDSPSLRHQIWQLNMQHDEVLDELNSLKKAFDRKTLKISTTETSKSIKELYELEFKNIENLENEITEYNVQLQDETTERMKQQKEICNKIVLLNCGPFECRSSEQFHRMCNFQTETDDDLVKNNKIVYKKSSIKKSVKFTSNIKLPKCTRKFEMDLPSLTDEEKSRLNYLLLDEAETDNLNNFEIEKSRTNISENDYKLKTGDIEKLHVLEEKLQVLQENGANNARKKVSPEAVQGWNRTFAAERLKQIDEQLARCKRTETEEK